jgi:hypothetical protein
MTNTHPAIISKNNSKRLRNLVWKNGEYIVFKIQQFYNANFQTIIKGNFEQLASSNTFLARQQKTLRMHTQTAVNTA